VLHLHLEHLGAGPFPSLFWSQFNGVSVLVGCVLKFADTIVTEADASSMPTLFPFNTLLEVVVRQLPSVADAQQYRFSDIYSGPLDDHVRTIPG
jgi:hypothetical protein